MTGSNKRLLAGWILSGLLAVLFIVVSARLKLTDWEGKAAEFAKSGFTTDLMFKIGVLEVIVTLVFLIPRTVFLGAILLTGYLGGAVVTHLRIGEPVFAPVLIGVLVWIAAGLRQPAIFKLALNGTQALTSPPNAPAASPSQTKANA